MATTATYIGTDSTTSGSWRGTYGSLGYAATIYPYSLPAGVTFDDGGRAVAGWPGSGQTDPRALQYPTGTDRGISCWFSQTGPFTLGLTTTDPINVSIYFCDWDRDNTRDVLVEWIDEDGTTILDSREVFNFHDGAWLTWTISGDLTVRFTSLSGEAAVVSGFYFDPVGSPPIIKDMYLAGFGRRKNGLA